MKFILTKRQKIIIAAAVFTIGLVITQRANDFMIQRAIAVFVVVNIVTCLWAMWEGMSRLKFIMLITLPALFSLGVASTLLLLKFRFLIKFPVILLFGVLFYFLLLAQNVFNVAAQRTIPLYRAAATASFVFTILTSVMLFHGVHTLSLDFVSNGLFVGLIAFVLILPVFWSIEMEKVTVQYLVFSSVLALIVGQLATALSFWPMPPDNQVWAVALGCFLFILLGISMDTLRERLSGREVYLYLSLGLFVLVVTFFSTRWVG